MSGDKRVSSYVARRYAKALFDLSHKGERLDSVRSDLEAFRHFLEGEGQSVRKLFDSPAFSKRDGIVALQAISKSAGFDPLTLTFLSFVVENRRASGFCAMIREYSLLCAAHEGEVGAEIVSASDLSKEQISALEKIISGSFESGRVKMKTSVDRKLLGGFVVKVGSRMIDASLRTKLRSLGLAMKEVS